MNNTQSFLTSLSAALLIATTSSAQEQRTQRGKPCCKNPPATTVQGTLGSPKTAEKTTAARLFNHVCPVTALPTNATTPTVTYAGYEISLCCANCIPLFAKLDKATKTAFLARFTGANRRVAFPAGTGAAMAAKSGCGGCGKHQGKGKTADNCEGSKCEDGGRGRGKREGSTKGAGDGMPKCSDKCDEAKKDKGIGQCQGEGRGKAITSAGSSRDFGAEDPVPSRRSHGSRRATGGALPRQARCSWTPRGFVARGAGRGGGSP